MTMTKEMAKDFADRMASLWACYYIEADGFKENRRCCPYYSEVRGIEMALKMMDVNFDYEFVRTDTEYKVNAITINGYTAIV